MADSGSISLTVSILPEEIRRTLSGETFSYTPRDGSEGWYYQLTNVKASPDELMSAESIIKSAGVTTGVAASTTVVANDLVRFLFVKNTGTSNGSSTTSDSVVLTFDNNNSTAYNEIDGVVIPAGMSWFGRFIRLPMDDIFSISVKEDESAVGDGPVQCIVAAILDDI